MARTLRDRGVEIHVIGHEGLRHQVAAEGFSFDSFTGVRPFSPIAARPLPVMVSDFARVAGDRRIATASLVVGHGGHSTAMRALSFGVPMVVMPANPMIDQKSVGAALKRAGAGVLLAKHARPQRIRRAIESMLAGETHRRAAAALSERIRIRDGAEVAGGCRRPSVASPSWDIGSSRRPRRCVTSSSVSG